MAFPASPAPSWYGSSILWTNVYPYSVQLSKSGATSYELWDWWGNVVESGSITGGATRITFTSTSLPYGWYRFKAYGPQTDSLFGNSYSGTMFILCPTDDRLPVNWGSAGNGAPGQHSNPPDFVDRACFGLGTARMTIKSGQSPNSAPTDKLSTAQLDAPYAVNWWSNPDATTQRITTTDRQWDSTRPTKEPWIQFDGTTSVAYDLLTLRDASSVFYATFYSKDPVSHDPQSVFLSAAPGTVSGNKFTVYYPNNSTVVETWDNIANPTALAAAINPSNGSAYIKTSSFNTGSVIAATSGPTAIGQGAFAGVKSVSQTLYPLGVHWFEGPTNEPNIQTDASWADRMRVFYKAVKAGNADAKVMGPTPVKISGDQLTSWATIISSGLLNYVDAIAFHDYNTCVAGDFNQGRNNIAVWKKMLSDGGYGSLPLWQTEAGSAACPNNGVYHPRRARASILHRLLWEQEGVPSERNNYWYDISHGFNSVPVWLWNGDGSPNPQVALLRTLYLETFQMAFRHRVDFGSSAGNTLFLGSVYGQRGNTLAPSCWVITSDSAIPGATVDLTITGTTSNITICDAWGNTTSLAQSSGRITVPCADGVPVYVRLPAGVTASVYQIFNWGTSIPPSVSSQATATLGGVTASALNDDSFFTTWNGKASTGMASGLTTMPDDASLIWTQNVTFQYLIAVCGPVENDAGALVKFTVDTWDGSSWTTQKTIDKSASAVSVGFVTDIDGGGCTRESYWDEQWKFPIDLGSPITAKGVRLHVTQTSYGVAPDSAAHTALDSGSSATQCAVLQELMVFSSTSFTPPSAYDSEVLADTPVGYWKLNDAIGSTSFADSSGNSLTGTVAGNPTFGGSGPISGGETSVTMGNTGSPELTVANNAALNVGNGPFTIELWVNTNGVSFAASNSGLFGRGTQGGTIGPGIVLDRAGTFELAKPQVATDLVSSAAISSGWNHIVATKSGGGSINLYLNGVNVGSGSSATTFGNPNASLTIGQAGSLGSPAGFKFAQVAFYNTALSAARVQTHYAAATGAVSLPANTTAPTLSGSGRIGVQHSCTPGVWSNRPTAISYQWKRDGVDIDGATQNLYLTTNSDNGHFLTCTVTATNLAGSTSVTTGSLAVARPETVIGMQVFSTYTTEPPGQVVAVGTAVEADSTDCDL